MSSSSSKATEMDDSPTKPLHNTSLTMLDAERPPQLTIDQAIDRLEKGKFQQRLLIASGMCNAVNAMAVMSLSFIRLPVRMEFGVSITKASWLSASVFFGILLGALFGPLGDRWGRKPMFLISSLLTAVLSLASSFVTSYGALVLLRFGVGCGVGGTVIPFDILAELTPSQVRGSYLLYLGYFWTVGTSVTPALAYFAMQLHESWRLFLMLSSIPAFVSSIFGILWVPESPRWLHEMGRSEDALRILRHGCRVNGRDPDHYFPVGTTIIVAKEEEEFKMNTMSSLFLPKWRWMVISMLIIWAFLDFIYWGSIQVSVLVFQEHEEKGGSFILFDEGDEFDYDYGAIVSSSLAEILGQTAVLLTIDRIGRVPTQAIAYALASCAIFFLCLCAYLEDSGNDIQRQAMILLAFLSRGFFMAATSVTWVHTAEMLPTPIRNTAHALCDALAGLGGAVSPWLVSPNNNMLIIGVTLGSITLLVACLVWTLPETRAIALGTAISRSASLESNDEKSQNNKGSENTSLSRTIIT